MPYLRLTLRNPRNTIEVVNNSERIQLIFEADLDPRHHHSDFKVLARKETIDGYKLKGTVSVQSDPKSQEQVSTVWLLYQKNGDGVGAYRAWFEVYVYLSKESLERLLQLDLQKNEVQLEIETPLQKVSDSDPLPLIYGFDPDGKELEWDLSKGNHTTIVKHSFIISPRVPASNDSDTVVEEVPRFLRELDEVIASLETPHALVPTQKLSQLIQDIINIWDKADTQDKRVNLLHVFDLAHQLLIPAIEDPELKKRIQESQAKIYKTFVLSECMIGTNVSADRLDVITKREIAAGRMEKDDALCKIARVTSIAPHLNEQELLAETNSQQPTKALDSFLSFASLTKKIRSTLRLLGI